MASLHSSTQSSHGEARISRKGHCFRFTLPHDSNLLDESEDISSHQIEPIREDDVSLSQIKEQEDSPSHESSESEDDSQEAESALSESGKLIEVKMSNKGDTFSSEEQSKEEEEIKRDLEPKSESDDQEEEIKSMIEPQLRFTQIELEYLTTELKMFFELPMFSHNLNCAVLLILKALFCFEKRKWDYYLHQIALASAQQGFYRSTANFLSYLRYRSGLRCIPISEMLISLKELIYDDQKHFFKATHARHFLSLDCLRDSVDYQILSKLKLGLDTPHSAGLARFFRHPIGRIFFPSFVYLYEQLIETFEQRLKSDKERKMIKRLEVEHLGQLTYIIEDYYSRFDVVKLDEEESSVQKDVESSFNQKFRRGES